MDPLDPRHGTEAGCREHYRQNEKPCAPCLEDHRRRNIMRRLYPHKRPAIGSQRRIQALQAIGYGRDRIAHEIGYSNGGSLAYLMRADTMLAVTAEKIADVYDQLSMTIPDTPGAARVRTWAKRHGYVPPLAWDNIDDPNEKPQHKATGTNNPAELQRRFDMAVVWRLVDMGQRVRNLTAAEASAAVEILRRRGLSGHEIHRDYGLNTERMDRRAA